LFSKNPSTANLIQPLCILTSQVDCRLFLSFAVFWLDSFAVGDMQEGNLLNCACSILLFKKLSNVSMLPINEKT
jgi:hypothetical protein